MLVVHPARDRVVAWPRSLHNSSGLFLPRHHFLKSHMPPPPITWPTVILPPPFALAKLMLYHHFACPRSWQQPTAPKVMEVRAHCSPSASGRVGSLGGGSGSVFPASGPTEVARKELFGRGDSIPSAIPPSHWNPASLASFWRGSWKRSARLGSDPMPSGKPAVID